MDQIGTITSLGSDKFLVNDTVMSIDELIMLLELERVDSLEQQLADELQSMAELNDLLKEANKMLSIARTEKGKLEGKGHSDMPPEMIDFFEDHDVQQGLSKYDKEHKGVAHGNKYLDDEGYDFCQNSDEWETSIENLKAFIDGLNSRSQVQMLRISSLIKKRDESLTMPSNTNNSLHQTNQGILNKI
ncbi:hypothetical protein BTA51_04730 [Hahella sp. CCB-MM4]|uniref:hypothetical protein n=1 Tax=Hahella sp. (strain CCB-MM4) TaxID=1926491 RepID=UPI000B9C59A5|nr:hypothetical protein [Hahella sp. CCB-MM4]OZG74320.1 hypothetical protein BTA51_04730 [Hahella sp. CCB-MM4]